MASDQIFLRTEVIYEISFPVIHLIAKSSIKGQILNIKFSENILIYFHPKAYILKWIFRASKGISQTKRLKEICFTLGNSPKLDSLSMGTIPMYTITKNTLYKIIRQNNIGYYRMLSFCLYAISVDFGLECHVLCWNKMLTRKAIFPILKRCLKPLQKSISYNSHESSVS